MGKNVRIGTLQEQLQFWKGQKRRLSSLTQISRYYNRGKNQ